MTLERHWPYTTPESKRKLAAVFRKDIEFWGEERPAEWEALADLQEAGRLEEYHAVRRRWKRREPHARDFV